MFRTALAVCFAFTLAVPVAAQQRLPDTTLTYARVDTIDLNLDLYLPRVPAPLNDLDFSAARNAHSWPLIIWFHGGGWRGGSRADPSPAMPLIDSGYAVASVIYRLSSQALWPAQLHDAKATVRADTVLAAVMHANNEVGTLQPIAAIGKLLREKGVTFFCDMTQSLGKLPVDLAELPVDLASFAAHKIGGPKGTGALYIRKGMKVESLVRGGGQERGMRGGTENVPGIAGFGAVAVWWREHGTEERMRVHKLRDALQAGLLRRIPDMHVTAQESPRLPNTLHATFPGARGDVMVMALDLRGIAVSAGSACASGSVKPSEVLLAMGCSPEEAVSSLRFSLGFGNTAEEIPVVADAVAAVYAAARTA
jgi:selenocysteine lyase/cysteine desulfurase